MTNVKCPKCGRSQLTDKQSLFCKNAIANTREESRRSGLQYKECGGFIVTTRDKVS